MMRWKVGFKNCKIVVAAWTTSQLSVHSLNGTVVNHIRYHEGLLGQRLGKAYLLPS
jgi:hypothetical protein